MEWYLNCFQFISHVKQLNSFVVLPHFFTNIKSYNFIVQTFNLYK